MDFFACVTTKRNFWDILATEIAEQKKTNDIVPCASATWTTKFIYL